MAMKSMLIAKIMNILQEQEKHEVSMAIVNCINFKLVTVHVGDRLLGIF